MLDRIARKQIHIGVLVQERFTLQLLYQRNAHHLQRSRADTERWRRRHTGTVRQAQNWKGQYRHAQGQINNL